MKLFTLLLTTLSLFSRPTSANVEKTIFLGPPAIPIPNNLQPIISDLSPNRLTPLLPTNQSSLRTLLSATFPTASLPKGTPTWFLLWDLTPGQRYEVRICWAATQPTSFDLETFTTPEMLAMPSFKSYIDSLPPSPSPPPPLSSSLKDEQDTHSYLFLRIHAAADFYTTNQTLMSHPPPVIADIILDPFLLNVLPRSLAPTVGYIIAVAIGSWFLAGSVNKALRGLIASSQETERDEKKTQ
ncbi:hypothetical protein QBC40DRAFT_204809 [Triangularia verruculosa]|uniref:Uncharacterized protein n=1 Tax=Triangularia verruculosa TaxID=2587418 RepID=A0AAN6XFJ0_9PEZI|nr:hypothetical protein QBC40DRAFT_204809 [Triangularia verruculosa]